ncbi:hypothetical protein HDU76_010637, partial [Blyttiomyces sp. JEL0837]
MPTTDNKDPKKIQGPPRQSGVQKRKRPNKAVLKAPKAPTMIIPPKPTDPEEARDWERDREA